LTKMRTDDHPLKNTWHNMASDSIEQTGSCRTTVTGVGGSDNDIVTRLTEMGSAGAECTAVDIDAVRLRASRANKKVLVGGKLTKGLRTIAPQLFNMEPHTEPEKHLSLKLDLYQMENLY
jgi:cell division GTPase FtsZ